MKRNLLILVIILLIGFITNSCIDDENECSICKNGQHCNTHCVIENCPVHDCKNHNKNECPICNPMCNLGAHLGIGETCNGTNCTLQDYRTAEQKILFPKEINRYGKASNYTAKQLTDTVANIIAGYGLLVGTTQGNFIAKAGKVCVTKAQNGEYTWDKTVFGFHIDLSAEETKGLMTDLVGGLSEKGPINGLVQLQPASDIRLAGGKKQTEQLSVVADYIDNLKYATVLYIKL